MWNYKKNNYNKYGAIQTTYNGIVYASKLEAGVAMYSDLLVKGKQIKSWDRQHKIDLYVYDKKGNKKFYKSWKVDFIHYYKNGKFKLVEAKGLTTEDYAIKKLLCEFVWLKENPDCLGLEVIKREDIEGLL